MALDQMRHSLVWNMKTRHNQVFWTAVRENRATDQRNPILRVATIKALSEMQSPEDVAARRGKSVEEILG